MRATFLPVPLLLILAATVLTGCGPSTPGESGATKPATANLSPSATDEDAVDASPVVHHIRIATEEIELLDSSDVALDSFDTDAPAAEVVAALTAAFGAEPAVEHFAAGDETPASTYYDWHGLVLMADDDPTRFPPYSTWVVDVNAPEVGGVPIYAGAELQVGDPMAEAIATQFGTGDWPEAYESFQLRVPVDGASVGEPGAEGLFLYVAVYGAAGGGGNVTGFMAPRANWGV